MSLPKIADKNALHLMKRLLPNEDEHVFKKSVRSQPKVNTCSSSLQGWWLGRIIQIIPVPTPLLRCSVCSENPLG